MHSQQMTSNNISVDILFKVVLKSVVLDCCCWCYYCYCCCICVCVFSDLPIK